MIIRADVKCYYCGNVSGQVEGDPEKPNGRWSYYPDPTTRLTAPRHPIRCSRCGGPVFLDEIETVRRKPSLAERPAAPAAG